MYMYMYNRAIEVFLRKERRMEESNSAAVGGRWEG